MQSTALAFKENAKTGLDNAGLQRALGKMRTGFQVKRLNAAAKLPEFERLRDQAKDIKNHVLANLDHYLEIFEENVTAHGGHVHWARNGAEARTIVEDICTRLNAKSVTKGKTMIAEEIGLNDHLEAKGFVPIETDLGEYIIQLRKEPPSHIIAPAIHLNQDQVEESFREHHEDFDPGRNLDDVQSLVGEARQVLRRKFQQADVGITGANFLIAETGTSIIVTNEGNGDLTQTLPRAHIVLASLEKVVPTLEDVSTILRVLARSATGQEFSVYTTFSSGPRRPDDVDGPEEYHVVFLDNGRSALIGTEMQEVLRCIRCGACMNHCPVYGAIGGHAYGWVYPGPIGAALNPGLMGVGDMRHLPNASSFCGRCEEVCPMRIPLPKIMRHWREKEFEKKLSPPMQRRALKIWAWLARRPVLYRRLMGIAMGTLGMLGRRRGRFANLPLAAGWTAHRDMPAPEGKTFQQQWAERQARQG